MASESEASSQGDEQLIFLIGLPRSGITLLQTLIGRHPDVYTYSESGILLNPFAALRPGMLEADAFESRTAWLGLQHLLRHTEAGVGTYLRATRAFALELYSSCLTASGKRLFLDKTPQYYLFLPELLATFPGAKYVFILRNPLWNLASVAEKWGGGKVGVIYSRSALMSYLFSGPKKIAAGLHALANNSMTVRYEDLVRDPERELRKVSSYLGIDFDPVMLTYLPSELEDERIGDLKILGRDRPDVASLSLPPLLLAPANLPLAISYLNRIGEDVYTKLGYDFAETRQLLLEGAHSRFSRRPAMDAFAALPVWLYWLPLRGFWPRIKSSLRRHWAYVTDRD